MEIIPEKVKELLSQGDAGMSELLEIVKTIHPADLADIAEQMDEEERKVFFSLMPAEIASETLAETREEDQEEVRDFVIMHEEEEGLEGLINLIGIESPGLTASLSIGKHVARIVDEVLS